MKPARAQIPIMALPHHQEPVNSRYASGRIACVVHVCQLPSCVLKQHADVVQREILRCLTAGGFNHLQTTVASYFAMLAHKSKVVIALLSHHQGRVP